MIVTSCFMCLNIGLQSVALFIRTITVLNFQFHIKSNIVTINQLNQQQYHRQARCRCWHFSDVRKQKSKLPQRGSIYNYNLCTSSMITTNVKPTARCTCFRIDFAAFYIFIPICPSSSSTLQCIAQKSKKLLRRRSCALHVRETVVPQVGLVQVRCGRAEGRAGK